MIYRKTFVSRLRERPFLLDGAMGSLLHSRGVPMYTSFDGINLTRPAVVADIPRGYIEAGADVIETNSFGANRFKLADYGLQAQVKEVNQAAVNIARRVHWQRFSRGVAGWLGGAAGGALDPAGARLPGRSRRRLSRAIEALLTATPGGVDLLIFETMSDLYEMGVNRTT